MQTMFNAPGAGSQPAADLIKDTATARLHGRRHRGLAQACRSSSISGRPGAGRASSSGPMLEKAVRPPRAPSGWSRSTSTRTRRSPASCASSRSRRCSPSSSGRPVDGFIGALPESQIKQFIDALSGRAAVAADDGLRRGARPGGGGLAAGDAGTASSALRPDPEHEPDKCAAFAGIARCLIVAAGVAERPARSSTRPRRKPRRTPKCTRCARPWTWRSRAHRRSGGQIRRRRTGGRSGRPSGPHRPRHALFGGGEQEAAMDQLLELVRRDREWNDEAARKQILKFFEALGPDRCAYPHGRTAMSSLCSVRVSMALRGGRPLALTDLPRNLRFSR